MIARQKKNFYAWAVLTIVVLLMTAVTAWAGTVSFPTVSGGEGTENSPYIITTPEELVLLAADVKSGTQYEGVYFRLEQDIDFNQAATEALRPTTAWNDETSTENNFTPIGYGDSFNGHFLGGGHTIRGIRIYDLEPYAPLGLFGDTYGAEVSGVTLADTRITTDMYVAGIVSTAVYGVISDCHVSADVALHCVDDWCQAIGGIVGEIAEATVENCTSSVTITMASGIRGCDYFAGIVGYNTSGTVTNCSAIGVVLPAVENVGAIVGGYDEGTMSNNTYHSCLVGTDAFNIGYGNGDIDGNALNTTVLHVFDGRDNTALIAAYANPSVHTANSGSAPNVSNVVVTLRDRTLYKDGAWNTICLPFCVDLTDEDSPLHGATARTLSDAYVDGSTLHLAFGEAVTELEAGVPYIIKWDGLAVSGSVGSNSASVSNPYNTGSVGNQNLISPVFTDTTISSDEPVPVTSQNGTVSFIGTYSPVCLAANDKSNMYFGANNKLLWPAQDVTIGSFRAYFKINGNVAAAAKGITNMVIDFGEDDEVATGVNEAAVDSSLFTPHSSLSGWHTVSGIRLSGKPSKKGVYIHNGKTVVIE